MGFSRWRHFLHGSNSGSMRRFFDTRLPSGGVLSRFNEKLTVSVDREGGGE